MLFFKDGWSRKKKKTSQHTHQCHFHWYLRHKGPKINDIFSSRSNNVFFGGGHLELEVAFTMRGEAITGTLKSCSSSLSEATRTGFEPCGRDKGAAILFLLAASAMASGGITVP